MKRWIYLVTVFVLIGIVFGVWFATSFTRQNAPNTKKTEDSAKVSENNEATIRVYAMGDMLPHDSVVNQAKNGNSYDFTDYFDDLRPLYKDADAVFCNPEAPVSGDKFGVSGYPNFNAPSDFARDLRSESGAGCNIITMGNNHTNDRGEAVLHDSIDTWRALKPLALTGASKTTEEQQLISTFRKKGIRVAFVALNEYSNNPPSNSYSLNSLKDETLVKSLMAKARQQADVVIVSIHWKQENSTKSSADQQRYAKFVASLGADVIIGTGPHVWQEVTYLPSVNDRRTLVWYSIGNMLSSQLTINQLTTGIAGFTINKDHAGKVTIDNITIDPVFMSYTWSAADKAAENLAARRDLRLQPLKDADSSIKSMFGTPYSATERLEFLKQTLGNEAPVVYR